MTYLKTFASLRDYAKGKISKDELLESDDLFSYMKEDRTTPGQSVMSVEFNNYEEFLKTFGFSEDDIWFYLQITSPYSSYEFYDYYSSVDQFIDGYGIYNVLDDDNTELLKKIGRMILPMKVNLESEEYRKSLSEKLMTNFKDEINSLINDFTYEMNHQMQRTAQDVISKDVDEYFLNLGFESISNTGVKITIADLLSLYMRDGEIQLSLTELFKKLFEDTDAPGGWLENQYEFEDMSTFDKNSFNRDAYRVLNNIFDKIEELGEEEGGVTIEDFTNMTERITKKFKQGLFYTLPKDKSVRFKIDGFKFPSMKVFVQLQKGLKRRDVILTEENFYHLLYQPSLFNLDEI
jgi:nucleoid DNA-binding protein